jgi:hypothetical protein
MAKYDEMRKKATRVADYYRQLCQIMKKHVKQKGKILI